MVALGKTVLLIEPYVGLVQQIAARLGFTSRAGGIKTVRGNDVNATFTVM
jgi:hypothetical protein